MATTYQQSCVMTFKDEAGDSYKLYPVTKKENVTGIDDAIRNQSVTTSGDGSAYTATVSGIDTLSVGVSFTMIPHVVSTSATPTIDVNGLGAKLIRRRNSIGTGTTHTGSSADWLAASKPVTVTYDGSFWIADLSRASATDLFGIVPITNGGTGGNSADTARANIGAIGMTTKTATLSAASWSNNTQTISVTGVTATNIVIPAPAPVSYVAYGDAAVRCTAQASNSLTFTCTDVPDADLSVNIIILA